MALFSACFFCLGAADYLTGSRLGLGAAFRQGLGAVLDLLILMTGFMALAPWLGVHLSPLVTPFFEAVGCDPSFFAAIFLSCDSGGAVLAKQITLDPAAGLYNGLVVASFLGTAISGTIPLALANLRGTKRAAAVEGLVLGFLVMPFACFVTGLFCRIPLSVLLANTKPIFVVAAILLVLIRFAGRVMEPLFSVIAFVIRAATLFGFCISVVQEASGRIFLAGLTPLSEIFPVICGIGVFLAGILPFFALVQRLLQKPLRRLANALGISSESITALVVTSANEIPTLLALEDLDEQGITLNTAFAMLASYSVGDFLAFSLQFSPTAAIPLMLGRLASGFAVILLCLAVFHAKKPRAQEKAS